MVFATHPHPAPRLIELYFHSPHPVHSWHVIRQTLLINTFSVFHSLAVSPMSINCNPPDPSVFMSAEHVKAEDWKTHSANKVIF
jgi:hypothetical protein